jgi:hypothetical protein
MLNNLSAVLDKAAAHAEAKKIDPAVLTGDRLYPNMLPLTSQVRIACDNAKGAVARLAGVEIPKHEDTEQSFAELRRASPGPSRSCNRSSRRRSTAAKSARSCSSSAAPR